MNICWRCFVKGLCKIWISLSFLFSLLPGSPCLYKQRACQFVSHFWDGLSSNRLGKMNLSHSRAKMSLLVQYVFSWYSVWNLRQIQLYRAWKELIVIGSSPSRNCSWTILKLIRKRSKKNYRKCQEITKESLLSRCRNSQNAKVNRCQFTT